MIGSNTKVLTSLGLLRLIEDGKLSLDDPITRFIPEFKPNDKGELTTKISRIPVVLQLDSEGWLAVRPGSVWTKLPPITRQLEGIKFREAEYFGRKVLLIQQRGLVSVIGEVYCEPQVNHAWLKALGIYRIADKQYKDMVQKAVLYLKDGDLLLTLYVEGEKMDMALSVINDREAVNKGFGRNMKESFFLGQKDGKNVITAMGVDLISEKQTTSVL